MVEFEEIIKPLRKLEMLDEEMFNKIKRKYLAQAFDNFAAIFTNLKKQVEFDNFENIDLSVGLAYELATHVGDDNYAGGEYDYNSVFMTLNNIVNSKF